MILRKYLSMLGIGAARIDLILPKESYSPGDYINGHFLVKGGTIEQQLKRIDCDLILTNPNTGIEKVVDTSMVLTSKWIESEESNKISFTFKLCEELPYSSDDRVYHFKTRLTFLEGGVESKDQDIIQIIPDANTEH
jgi:sporulation-control protein